MLADPENARAAHIVRAFSGPTVGRGPCRNAGVEHGAICNAQRLQRTPVVIVKDKAAFDDPHPSPLFQLSPEHTSERPRSFMGRDIAKGR